MNTRDFVEKAQELLPEYVLNELEKQEHTGTLTSTCKGHMLLAYILEFGATILAQRVGQEEIQNTIWKDIGRFVESVNEQHLASLEAIREKYPTEFAEAEAKAMESTSKMDRQIALLKGMLGQEDS